MKIRVGLGFDVHQLVEGKDFFLGGIRLEGSSKGATGHSDADVLVHAICDALLGAAGLRDIGFHFANDDARWRGMDSKFFLKEVMDMLAAKGWRIGNVDCVVLAESPKLATLNQVIRERIAEILRIDVDRVSLKGKTGEGTGDVGQGRIIQALCVCLLNRELS